MAVHYRKLCQMTGEKELFLCTDILKIAPSGNADMQLTLDEIRALSGNERCADCNSPDTSWASTNLGVFLCIRCSGVHRSLGVHISTILSCTLDIWTDDLIHKMEIHGNKQVNAEYEYHLQLAGDSKTSIKLHENSSMQERQLYIKAKYVSKDFHRSCDQGRFHSYSVRRSKLMKSRILSSSQTNLRTMENVKLFSLEKAQKGMIQYCGIVFVEVNSISKNTRGKNQKISRIQNSTSQMISSSLVSFTLGGQTEVYKDMNRIVKECVKLNLPMNNRLLEVTLRKRSRIKQASFSSSFVIDLGLDVYKDGKTVTQLFTFPDTKICIELALTLQALL